MIHIETTMAKSIKLNTGGLMPILGYGTYRLLGTDVYPCMETAIKAGYRSIDTASVYRNEAEIAKTLKDVLPKYGLTRKDIFITSKLEPKDQGDACKEAVLRSLTNLETDYLDLYFIHWPGVKRLKPDDPRNSQLRKLSWLHMERYHKEGKLKAIGVSNYSVAQMKELLSYATVKPAVLQVECHPYLQQKDLIDFCEKNDIHFQAFSSLGTMAEEKKLLKDEVICKIANTSGKTPAQILLRWAVQQNVGVIPKSANHEHIKENLKIFDFELTKADMDMITPRHNGTHFCWNPEKIV